MANRVVTPWDHYHITKDAYLARAANKVLNTVVLRQPLQELQWNDKGPIPFPGPGVGASKAKSDLASVVAFIYGREYVGRVRCGMCNAGFGNYARCRGVSSGGGQTGLLNGACAVCIQQGKAQGCEWNQISGVLAESASQHKATSALEHNRRRDFIKRYNPQAALNGAQQARELPAWGAQNRAPSYQSPSPPALQQHHGPALPPFAGGPDLLSDPPIMRYGQNTYASTHVRGLMANARLDEHDLHNAAATLMYSTAMGPQHPGLATIRAPTRAPTRGLGDYDNYYEDDVFQPDADDYENTIDAPRRQRAPTPQSTAPGRSPMPPPITPVRGSTAPSQMSSRGSGGGSAKRMGRASHEVPLASAGEIAKPRQTRSSTSRPQGS